MLTRLQAGSELEKSTRIFEKEAAAQPRLCSPERSSQVRKAGLLSAITKVTLNLVFIKPLFIQVKKSH